MTERINNNQKECTKKEQLFILKKNVFPKLIDGKIDTYKFLESSVHMVEIIDKVSKIFAPVKYDMMRNIEKVNACYSKDKLKNIYLLVMIEEELKVGDKSTAESLLWLNRALLFTELVFIPIILGLKDSQTINMKKVLANAYEGSVRQYHNWVSQQLFACVSRLCPTLDKMVETLELGGDNMNASLKHLEAIIHSMSLVRIKIDDFYNIRNIKF